ncbi:MAG: Hsp20/alpha crystallin family protein [Acetobacteraceae bacterium]|jgi:HSP20 family protein|nr:Hsp20/alpha crystallin family protein [Acetobacteraceae bacterium]
MALLPTLFGGQNGLERMLDDMRRVQQQIEQAFGAGGAGLPTPVFRSDWRPAIDVKETPEGLTVTAELPGLDQGDVEIALDEDVLTIKGEKKAETSREEKGVHIQERAYGSFSRSLQLPFAPKADAVSAAFAKGVLTVTLPKPAEAEKKTSRIEIKAG